MARNGFNQQIVHSPRTPVRGLLLFTALALGVFAPATLALADGPVDPATITEANASDEAEMKPYKEVISGPNIRFDMVPIPGGTFMFGSPEGEADRYDDEGPQVEVAIEPFWMGAMEVTWDEYEVWMFKLDAKRREIMNEEPLDNDKLADAVSSPTAPFQDMTFDMGKEGYPAICMTQLAAKKYTQWLSQKTGRFYRLPTEAEWEYACRAGSTTAYHFGDDADQLGEYAWFFDNAEDKYQPVGKKKPNPWGLYDMHGNVLEWVLDQYIEDRYASIAAGARATEAVAWPTDRYPRLVRGGSWYDDPDRLRSAARTYSDESWKSQDPQFPKSIWYHTDATWVGFRVVRPLVEPTEEEKRRYWEPDLEEDAEIMEFQRNDTAE
jgi:formylglycine-generating enzyme required for sulfatase activity